MGATSSRRSLSAHEELGRAASVRISAAGSPSALICDRMAFTSARVMELIRRFPHAGLSLFLNTERAAAMVFGRLCFCRLIQIALPYSNKDGIAKEHGLS